MSLQELRRMRAIRVFGALEALPVGGLMATDTPIRAAEAFHPHLLDTGWDGVALVGAELRGDLLAELQLVVAPVVRAVAREKEHAREDQKDAHDRQRRAVEPRIGRVRSLLHFRISSAPRARTPTASRTASTVRAATCR